MIRTILTMLTPAGRGKLAGFLSLAMLGALLRAASCVLLVPLVAALFGEEPADAWPWTVALVVVAALGWVVDTVSSRRGMDLGFDILDSGQRTVADRISSIRLEWFDSERTRTARQAIAATGHELVSIFIYLFAPVLGAVALPIFIGIGLLPISWPLGLAALAGVPLLALAFWASTRMTRSADRAASRANGVLTQRIVEFARTQQALRAARRVQPERSHAGAALDSQHAATTKLLLLQVPGELIFGLATQLALLLLAGTTVVLSVNGDLNAPQAIALIVVMARYLEAFNSLSELSGGIEATAGVLADVRKVLDAPTVPGSNTTSTDLRGSDGAAQQAPHGTSAAGNAPGATPTSAGPTPSDAATDQPGPAPRVELRDVGFGYGPDQPVLQDFSLTLEPGTTTAIVGPSGSGKSTVLDLIAGLRAPSSGTVAFDGVDADSLAGEARREQVSVVFQHPYLFEGSLRENVLVGHPDASESQVRTASELAHVGAIVDRAPDGWDSPVGEAGSTLSGGERQRVSIARALLKPAPVLLVDEATSALDTENEAAVVAALAEDPTPRTRVIVAHRLSSIRTADRVVFLERGRIVEDGTVDELLAADGRFANFWTQQDAAGGWRLA